MELSGLYYGRKQGMVKEHPWWQGKRTDHSGGTFRSKAPESLGVGLLLKRVYGDRQG